jgi:hypothetical protein
MRRITGPDDLSRCKSFESREAASRTGGGTLGQSAALVLCRTVRELYQFSLASVCHRLECLCWRRYGFPANLGTGPQRLRTVRNLIVVNQPPCAAATPARACQQRGCLGKRRRVSAQCSIVEAGTPQRRRA